jgi:hypothetical protein
MAIQSKPWPIADMIRMYDSGKSLDELAGVLRSEEWQKYWIQHTGANYYPSQKVVNKVMKKHHILRGRGAPGERNGSWKGGVRVDRRGYILVYKPEHPFAAANGCVRLHRLVAEEKLGRYLTQDEVVHHKDEDPGNNSPDNLMVYATNAIHIAETLSGRSTDGQKQGLRRAQDAKRDIHDPDKYWPWYLLHSLRHDGLSSYQIAELLDCDRRTVSRHLKRHGLPENVVKTGVITERHREQCRQFLASLEASEDDAPLLPAINAH